MRFLLSVILLSSIVCLSGCGTSGLNSVKQSAQEYNKSRIQLLRNCYFMYMEDHGYKGPADEAELKAYLKEGRPTRMMAAWQVAPEQIDQMWVSERDNEPFVVRWGVNGMGADHAVIFEAKGIDGKRLVAFDYAKELDDAEYEGYLSGKTKPVSQSAALPTTAEEAGVVE